MKFYLVAAVKLIVDKIFIDDKIFIVAGGQLRGEGQQALVVALAGVHLAAAGRLKRKGAPPAGAFPSADGKEKKEQERKAATAFAMLERRQRV